MSPRVPAVLLALLAAVTVAAVAGTALSGGVAAQETPTNGTITPEETVIEVQLQAEGDARWTITEHFAITDEAERAAFDDLGDSFESGAAGSLGVDTFSQSIDAVDSETERSMQRVNLDRRVERENESLSDVRGLNGTMSVSFTWTNFARERGDSYVVDDAFETGEGPWLSGLTSDERLVIALPARHGASSAPKGFEQNELRWEGPTSFESGYLRIVYSGNLEPPNPDDGEPLLVWGALGVAVVALLGAGLLLARRRGIDPHTVFGPEDGDEPDDVATDPPVEESETEADDEADPELLSDEERVERLLDQNGGRMKQANIVKETGWSNAKVSQLLSSMEDEDEIQKLRIGRENLITFPDEDVGEFES